MERNNNLSDTDVKVLNLCSFAPFLVSGFVSRIHCLTIRSLTHPRDQTFSVDTFRYYFINFLFFIYQFWHGGMSEIFCASVLYKFIVYSCFVDICVICVNEWMVYCRMMKTVVKCQRLMQLSVTEKSLYGSTQTFYNMVTSSSSSVRKMLKVAVIRVECCQDIDHVLATSHIPLAGTAPAHTGKQYCIYCCVKSSLVFVSLYFLELILSNMLLYFLFFGWFACLWRRFNFWIQLWTIFVVYFD